MRRPFHTIAAVTGALAFTLAACGDDDDDADTTAVTEATEATEATEPADTEPPATEAPTTEAPTTEAPTTEAPTTEAPTTTAAPTTTEAEPELGSIIDVLTEDGRFTTLLTALDAAGFTEELSTRAVTLLAPTDEAFTALGQPAIDALLADPAALANVLQGHVLPVPQDAEAISVFGNVLAINSSSWDVVVDGDTVTIGGATVIAPDLEADNGWVHGIDAVLVPAPAPAG
jgi:uncharacterized surface protein with fasciclin (FAS1) repeats